MTHRDVDTMISKHRNTLQEILKSMDATIDNAVSLEGIDESDKVLFQIFQNQ